MRSLVLAAAVAVAACSAPQPENAAADVNAAAQEAQGDIDTYAANTLAAPTPAPVIVSATPIAAPTIAPTRADTVAETPFTADSAQGAADVVQTYYALLEERKYDRAWRLWDDGGRASGLTPRQFADSFAKYASYHAAVGTRGEIEAGAGQRYITVRVRVYGTLVEGKRPFAMRGSLTLHRVGDIDGATAEQLSWRIRDSTIRPRSQEALAAAPHYDCAGMTRVSARADDAAGAPIWRRGEAGAPCTAAN